MDFDLTQEIVDQIIYAMEDQHEEFLVDSRTGDVVTADSVAEDEDGEAYVEVPDWRPVDGFQLMERFVLQLRNPLLRERLRAALSSGRGVFRSFKDALRSSPEAERRWYLFKEREMRRVVQEWYNQLREIRGLEQLPFDDAEAPVEPEELLLSEFIVRPGGRDDAERAADLDRLSFDEQFHALGEPRIEELYGRRRRKYPGLLDPASLFVVAEHRRGEPAGMGWAALRESSLDDRRVWRILQLVVDPVYRGLGLGELLLRRLLRELRDRGAGRVTVELMFGSLELRQLFARQGFEPLSELMGMDVGRWEEP